MHPRTLLPLALLALAPLGCAGPGQAGRGPSRPAPIPGAEGPWRTFEDRYLRLGIPAEWEAEVTAESPGRSITWRIAPPEARKDFLLWGVITATVYVDGHEKRPLKTLFKEATGGGLLKPVGSPRRARMGKGDCLAYRSQLPAACGASSAGKGPCVETWVEMRCYGAAGRYFEVRSAVGRHPASGPDGAALDRLRLVDRILSGLELR